MPELCFVSSLLGREGDDQEAMFVTYTVSRDSSMRHCSSATTSLTMSIMPCNKNLNAIYLHMYRNLFTVKLTNR